MQEPGVLVDKLDGSAYVKVWSSIVAALAQVRQHLLGRTARDFQTHLVNPGSLAGRD